MQTNIFIPQNNQSSEANHPDNPVPHRATSKALSVVHVALLCLAGGLALVFVPGLWASLGFTKALFSAVLIGVVIVCGVLHIVIQPHVKLVMPKSVLLLWGLSVLSVLGALLSPQSALALWGSYFEVQSAAFLVLFTLVVTVSLSLIGSSHTVRRLIMISALSMLAVLFYALLRVVFGPSFLSFGSFGSLTVTPVGGFNDLAVVAGVLLIGSMTTISSAPVTKSLQILLTVVVAISLLLLIAVNFTLIWWLVGLVVAGIAVKQLMDIKVDTETEQSRRLLSLSLAAVVLLVCGWYGLSNTNNGTFVQRWADISYVEVRPSFTATTDLMRAVYGEQALLGAGPNQFASVWRVHKDLAINETVFWNTDFVSGYSFLLTSFIQLGLLGGLLLVAFQLWFVFAGYRALIAPAEGHARWTALTAVSFVIAVFLWVISDLYTPGSFVMLLLALATGISVTGIAVLRPSSAFNVSIVRRASSPSVVKIVGVLVVIGSVGTGLFGVLQQYQAEAMINEAVADGSLSRADTEVAYQKYPDPRFLGLRSQLSAISLRQIANKPNPDEADQARFLELVEVAVEDARSAVAVDRVGVSSHLVMASVFNTLANTGVTGAREIALETLTTAKIRAPKNPELTLAEAQVHAQASDVEAARAALEATLALKSNYTPALILLTEIDIASGDLASAIERTRAVVTLEPRNPTRYFQLGVLYAANQQLDQAEGAYSAALTLDPQYANARYMLAQLYVSRGDRDTAITLLEQVLNTNQGNAQLQNLITDLKTGTTTAIAPADVEIEEPTVAVTPENEVVTDEAPDTELIVPVNGVSADVAE